MILRVFTTVGCRLRPADAFQRLCGLYAGEAYPARKASGSLGGAVNGKTIALDDAGYYVRIR